MVEDSMRPPASAPTVGRLRLRAWLEEQIQSGGYPGVSWLDQPAGVFQIPWKHAARHGWSIDRDASLFRSWAMYTGRYLPGRDKPDPKTWKANFRCALNSLPDVRELKEQSLKRGSLASRVYMLLPRRTTGRRRKGHQVLETPMKHSSGTQSSLCVTLDRFTDVFCSPRGHQDDLCSGPFQARARESLPPYSTVKQEEATTAEQISYSSASSISTSGFHLLPQASSCTPHTQYFWDSPASDQEQTEAVFKIVDHMNSTDLWGQSGDHRGWRLPSCTWEDCSTGDLDSLPTMGCLLQTDTYAASGPFRTPLEAYTPGMSQ